jgi:hypothetical protein
MPPERRSAGADRARGNAACYGEVICHVTVFHSGP